MAASSESSAPPESIREEEKFAALAQLERLLATPYFSHSRRFPAFLRYIVRETIEGRGDRLKERTIGVEIFGKSADYDTALDPIVRVTAGEVRKRIAQYYQEPGHEHELRLSLPPGSYVPQFHYPGSEAISDAPVAQEEAAAGEDAATSIVTAHGQTQSNRRYRALAAAAALLLIGATVFLVWRNTRTSAFAEFWDPILSSPDPVLVCVADQTQYTAISLRDAADPSRQVTLQEGVTAVVIDDLNAIIKIAGVLQSSGKHYSLRGQDATNLMDLRNGPSVIIGAYDNAWTLRMLKPLRFHFANNADMTMFSIVDAAQQSQTRWVLDRRQQVATNNYRDYAIVARFTDDITGKPTLIAAGIARGGTIAAGEFLTSPSLLEAVRQRRPSAKLKNVEVVLSTEIINGEPGTPSVEAVYYW
jgi:hypothetical protein